MEKPTPRKVTDPITKPKPTTPTTSPSGAGVQGSPTPAQATTK